MARVLIIDRRAQPYPAAASLRARLGANPLASSLAQADVVLVLVRPDFATATNDDGHRLLFAPQDEVRAQIRAALEAGTPILALLLDGASMPAQSTLPSDLVPLARRQALPLDPASDDDVARLHSAITHVAQVGASTVQPSTVVPDDDPQLVIPTTATPPVQPTVGAAASARTPGPQTAPLGSPVRRRWRGGAMWAAMVGLLLLAGLGATWALLPQLDLRPLPLGSPTAPPSDVAMQSTPTTSAVVVRPPALTPLGPTAIVAGHTATPAPVPTGLAAAAMPEDCPGALSPRLGVGMAAVVETTNDRRVNLRAAPATSSAQLRQITPMKVVRVVGGPVCDAERVVWFEVDDGDGPGWLAEGTVREGYFVRPVTIGGVAQAAFAPRGAGCTRVVFDDFTRSASQWFITEDPTFRLAAEDGAYTITITAPNTTGIPLAWGTLQNEMFGDVHVAARVSATRFDGPSDQVSLWLNYQNARNFLAFTLRSDGHAAITRVSGGGTTLLRAWEPSDAIVTGDGAQNLIEVQRSGGTYTMLVNFVPVATTIDTTWERGRIGFRGASYRLPAAFRLEAFRACAQG